MPKFVVTAKKERELRAAMERLGIREEDLQESFVRSSGPGGQKVNKTSSCVRLVHAPTGTEVKVQQARSQSLNRYLARRELCERMDRMLNGRESEQALREGRARKQKDRRRRRQRSKPAGEGE